MHFDERFDALYPHCVEYLTQNRKIHFHTNLISYISHRKHEFYKMFVSTLVKTIYKLLKFENYTALLHVKFNYV